MASTLTDLPAARRWRWAAVAMVVAIAVRVPWMARPGFPADQAQFVIWAKVSQRMGLAALYQIRSPPDDRRLCNYPPGYLYVLRGLAYGYEVAAGKPLDAQVLADVAAGRVTAETKVASVVFKTPAVLADGAIAGLIALVAGGPCAMPWAGLVYALAPPAMLDSAVWGQADALPILAMIASIEAARRRRRGWMVGLAVVALFLKPQAGMVAPIWLMVWLEDFSRRWRERLREAGWGLVTAVALLLPFGFVLDGVWDAYAGASGYYPFTHLNGFSAWFLGRPLAFSHFTDNLNLYYRRDDVAGLLGRSLRAWGAAGLMVVWGFAILVLYRRRQGPGAIRWAARVLSLAFFVLSTQMHERYLVYAVAMWIYAASGRWQWAATLSVVLLGATLNILWVWPGPEGTPWSHICETMLHRRWGCSLPGEWVAWSLIASLLWSLIANGEKGS